MVLVGKSCGGLSKKKSEDEEKERVGIPRANLVIKGRRSCTPQGKTTMLMMT